MTLANGQLAELLARAAEVETGHRKQALQRAARSAFAWPEEAVAVAESGRPLTALRGVGPWLERVLLGWLADPPEPPEPPDLRSGFLTLAEARATLTANPDWSAALRADLQMHTTYSDGKSTLREMVEAAATYGYEHVAITDHSQGLRIAGGMNEQELAVEQEDIALLNEELEAGGARIRALCSLEMNLSPEGEGDMDPEALSRLDLVLGAFHSKLRVTEDQTGRYLAAVRNRTVHVLAHPRGRRFNVRLGLHADWAQVFDAAAETGTALEIDAFPDRQDLDVDLLKLVRDSGAWVSIGTDAHHTSELGFMEYGLAAAIRAGIPRDRILNFLAREELLAWARREPARF
jgi:histidinol phosphatase-like PHP family hydrolase